MTMTMTIASILLAASFVGVAIWRKKELPESISAMVYDLSKDKQWIWSAWFAGLCILIFIPLVVKLGGLGWLIEVCLLGCAITPLVRSDTRKYHYWFAYIAGALSQLGVALICPQWLGVWMVFAFLIGSVYVQPWGDLAKIVEHKGAFVAEVCCWLSLMGCLIIK